MKSKLLNIFFVVDKNYLIPFTVALTSILENNSDLELNVFVIHEMDKNDQLDTALVFFKENYNLSLKLIKIEDTYFEQFFTSNHITKTSYFRLLLGQFIPKYITQGLYIDCDTVITGSLKNLCDYDFFDASKGTEISLLAVDDSKASKEIERIKRMGVDLTSYFNAGVIYLNLKKWRVEQITEKMVAVGEKYHDQLTYHDQDILNIFFKDDKDVLDPVYNMDANLVHPELPIVLHYLGLSKPWQFTDNGPYKKCYNNYLRLTPFKNLKTETITVEKVARKYVRLFKRKMKIDPYIS